MRSDSNCGLNTESLPPTAGGDGQTTMSNACENSSPQGRQRNTSQSRSDAACQGSCTKNTRSASRWIPVAEKLPAEMQTVIVGQILPESGLYRKFAGWLRNGVWHSYLQSQETVADMGDLRAIDFWLPIPEWDPGANVFDMGWPA